MAKILYVEDNEDNAFMLSTWLKRQDHQVLIAETGEEGVAAALSELPDIILMDLDLPGIDGFEATRQIKACKETKQIPVIVVSANAMSTDKEKAFEAGAEDFESKPIKFDSLDQRMSKLLVK